MREFQGFSIVFAVVAICLDSGAATAQVASRPSVAYTEVSTGTPSYPAGSIVPSAAASQGMATMPSAPAEQPCCGTGGCDVGCGGRGGCGSCDPVWRFFGDFLCLRPRNQGVEYAAPFDSTLTGSPLQAGPTLVMNPEYSAGFRAGGVRALDGCSEVAATYTYYRSENSLGPDSTRVGVQPMVFEPSTPDAGSTWTDAAAHEINTFQYADIDYRHNIWGCDCTSVNYFIGMRYASLGQEFDSTFTDPNLGIANMWTHVNFDGVGLRLGLDGERIVRGGFFATAKAAANFVGGEFRADYLQGSTAAPVEATTDWREARFVSILEAEVSVGWQSPEGHFRASVGYLLTDWCNAVKPSDYINSIQTNSYRGANTPANTSLVFDGFTVHAEVIW